MANDNLYPGQMSGQPIGTGEGESPLTKPTVPNMDVRTMASDMQSINTGSPAPQPYSPRVSAPENIPVAPAVPAPEQSFQIPQTDSMSGQTPSETPPKKSNKGLFTAIIVFIAIIALAALGYFVIYPIFFGAPTTPTPPLAANVNPEPTLPPPEPTPAPAPTSTPPKTASAPAHVSLFTIPADSQIEAAVVTTGATLSSPSITATPPGLTEVTYRDSNGNFLKTADILKSALGALALVLTDEYKDASSAGLIYTDNGNVRWLGFVFQPVSDANLQGKQTDFRSFLEKLSFNNLFATDPGTAQTWKDGQISGVTGNRYLLFSKSGFAVDYGWVGNKLVIMTSYNGFKEAVRRLQ